MRMAESSTNAKIPFKKINLGNVLERIKPLIDSGYIGLGNVVFDFEKKLAEYSGARFAVAVDSCTSALFLSAKYEYEKKGLRLVRVPSMTVPLALNAMLEAGLKVVLDDRHQWIGKYYQMMGSSIFDSAHEVRRNQFRYLKDHGAPDDLKLCYSFYPTKTIGSADGGAILTDDEEFAKWAKSAATYGRNQGNKYQNSWDYDVEMIGYKRHYTNLQAAICLEQLERLDETNAKRQAIMRRYNEAFKYNNDSDYLFRLNMTNKDEFIEYALEQGIECGVHFKPLHKMTPFVTLPMTKEAKAECEDAYSKTVSLPFYDTMTPEEVERVIDCVLSFKKGEILV